MTRPIIAITYSSAELDVFNHWRYMFKGIVAAGGVPLAIDCRSKVEDIATLVQRADALIIGGGGDVSPEVYGGDPADPTLSGMNPLRDENEIASWKAAHAAGIPVLAICRGAQLMTALLGGELYVDLQRDFDSDINHRRTENDLVTHAHSVTIDPSSEIAHWLNDATSVEVNSQHHQGLKSLAPQTCAVAHASDGLIEAFEWPEANLVAIQWHPEVLWSTDVQQLQFLKGFVDKAVRERKILQRLP